MLDTALAPRSSVRLRFPPRRRLLFDSTGSRMAA
jgi:hypothetical protein